MIQTLDKYTGHKKIDGVYQKIINNIPAHKVYYELFAGSASILSLITVPAREIRLNDIDPEVQQLLMDKFPNAIVTNVNAIDTLKITNRENTLQFVDKRDVFLFLDPPYLHDTRTDKELYKYEMQQIDHVKLLTEALQLNCNCMIIHPKCDLYNTMLYDWYKIEIKIRYNRKTSIEFLYMNYPPPTELQCFDYLGSSCWNRQQIKRKGDRLLEKLKKLPVLEQNYLLNRLKELA
ncbi:DNA adenine methylase [Flavobacterium sp.]|uniref:DNA adenine methylase n=1 Tax=Flavobacterium sp. TaxID=239 RepID=UPI0037539DA8